MLLSNKDQTTTLALIITAKKYLTVLEAIAKGIPKEKEKERQDAERELLFARAVITRAQGLEARLRKKIKINPLPAAPGPDRKEEAEKNDKG